MNDLQVFNEIQTNIAMAVAPIKTMVVRDMDTSTSASSARRALRNYEKEVDKKLKEITDPLNAQIKRAREFAKQILIPIDDADAYLENQLKEFAFKLEQECQELLRVEREEKIKRDAEMRIEIEVRRIAAEAEATRLKDEADFEASLIGGETSTDATKQTEILVAQTLAQAEAEAQRIEFEARKEHWDAKKEIAQIKVEGERRVWKYRIIDQNLIPSEYFVRVLDEEKIKQALKLKIHVAGVEWYQELTLTRR